MPAPLVSVIIPHLNQPDYLRRCLASLRAQNFQHELVEIVVVDNGSTFPPTDICESFGGVRLEHEKAPGPGPARNKGIAVSHGPILAFIDADCIADPNWLSAIVAALSADGTDQIVGGDVRIALADPSKPTRLEAYESVFSYRQQDYIERQGFSGTGNLAMRREVYVAVGPFAGIRVAEDRDWGRRATACGFRISYRPDVIVFHPARSSLDELIAKWDRHISHDFAERRPGLRGWVHWGTRALAIAVSPAFEMPRIVASRRIATWRERRLAAQVLVGIRFYRAGRMLRLLSMDSERNMSRFWNRD